jgi:hypothetical protein
VERPAYYTLGFTGDDITGAWQHWRLAQEFHRAFEAHGLPPSFGVVEAAGEGEHPLYWFVSAQAAEILDRHDVEWRRFLVRTDLVAPRNARPALSGAR